MHKKMPTPLIILLVIIFVIIIVLAINYGKTGGDDDNSDYYDDNLRPRRRVFADNRTYGDNFIVGIKFSDRVFSSRYNNDIYIIAQPIRLSVGDSFMISENSDIFELETNYGETTQVIYIKAGELPRLDSKINYCIYRIMFENSSLTQTLIYIENCRQVGSLPLFEDNNYYYFVLDNDAYRANPYFRISKETLIEVNTRADKIQLLQYSDEDAQIEISEHKTNDGRPIFAKLHFVNRSVDEHAILLTYVDGIRNGDTVKSALSSKNYEILYNSQMAIKIVTFPTFMTVKGREERNPRYVSIQSDNIVYRDRASENVYYMLESDDLDETKTILMHDKAADYIHFIPCLPGTENCNGADDYSDWSDPALAPIQFVDTDLGTI